MKSIDYYPKYIVDTCVMMAYMDEGESHHKEALNFFVQLGEFIKVGKKVEIVVPAHLYLEFNINITRKKEEVEKDNNVKYNFRQPQEFVSNRIPYPITAQLMKQIEDSGLYEKFRNKLKMGDFIYAAISYLESIPLVTLDKKDFSKIASDIELIFLNP